MATTILSVDAADGDWHGYGTAGCWLANYPSETVQLPSWVSAVDRETSTSITRDLSTATGVDGVALDAAGSSRSTVVLYSQSPGGLPATFDWIVRADEEARYFASLRMWNNGSGRPATLTVLTDDGLTVLDGPTTAVDTNAGHGYWGRVYCEGPVRLRITGVFPMSQGVLLDIYPGDDSPGRLCALDGKPGLAF